jgi:hypothetical protein
MLKLDMILENVRNQYTLGLLEESTLSEKDVLQGKMLINESTMGIRKILVDEKVIEETRSMLQETWEQELFEAAHDNHPHLSKTARNNGSYKDGMQIQKNRDNLANDIKEVRKDRDEVRKKGREDLANRDDNFARGISQVAPYPSMFSPHTSKEAEFLGRSKYAKAAQAVPRFVSSAKK